MANTLTITGTDANAVRLAVAFIRDYWQGPADFTGVIIQNKTTSAAMLSTDQISSGGGAELTDPARLTDAQYAALQASGTPSPACVSWINSKLIQGMRGHILTFERDRALAGAAINSWTMTG